MPLVFLTNGEHVDVEKVQHELLGSPVKVYNFQVADYHTYYVANGVLVHNTCGKLPQNHSPIGGWYVYYYNVKYQRVGHLFQDRFKSESVEDDAYFLTVLRYIHQNPVKAGMCSKVEDYLHSSFGEYLCESTWLDTDFALAMFERIDFTRFNNEPNSDSCLEIVTSVRRAITDSQAQIIIQKVSHCGSISEFQGLDETKKERFVKKIYEKGASVRQISRLTSTAKGMVEKWLKV